MKDITRRIFEKENQAEVSNNLEKKAGNKSFTQLVSLTLMNRQPKMEYKSIDLKGPCNYSSLTTRPLQVNKQSFHNRPEVKQKTTTSTLYSPTNRTNTSISVMQEHKSHEVQRLLHNYSDCIIEYYHFLDRESTPKNFLKTHTISTNLRAKMVDWMVEVLTSYKCKDQTFFLATRLMDHFLWKISKSNAPQDLHLIGVTCMFIASKFEEIYPVKLQVVHEKIAHKKLTKDEIKDKETLIASTLDFKLTGVTIHDLITVTLTIMEKYQQLYQTTIYLAKMAVYDYDNICNISYTEIAGACIILGSKIMEQVDPQIQSEPIIPQVVKILKLDQESVMDIANNFLKLAKGFEKQYPNLENLKKFTKFSFQDALKNQK